MFVDEETVRWLDIEDVKFSFILDEVPNLSDMYENNKRQARIVSRRVLLGPIQLEIAQTTASPSISQCILL